MKRVGILTGREATFPESIIRSINEKGNGEVVAEMVKFGGIRIDEERKYDVIIDRISHEIPYYRATLKRMALEGTYVINNPFWWSADDKFFNFSLAAKIGIAIPKTVLLPQQNYIPDITSESLRNLEFPLDWEGIDISNQLTDRLFITSSPRHFALPKTPATKKQGAFSKRMSRF